MIGHNESVIIIFTMQPHKRAEVNPEELKSATKFALNLFAVLKDVQLYPKGHQILLQVVEKFFDGLKELFAQKQLVAFRIFENNLYVLDVPLDAEKTPGANEFIEELQKRYIRQIIFNSATTITDINALIEVLNTAPENIAPQGGASNILMQHGSQGIKIIEYYSRRHTSLDQERLLSLTNSEIFRFFTDETMTELSSEQAQFLYELLKESNIMCTLIKVAAQYILREQTSQLNENQTILKILNKIKGAIVSADLSEEDETKTIFKDLIMSFGNEDLFNLIFENPEDEIIQYTNTLTHLSRKLDNYMTAELIVKKIEAEEAGPSVLSHVKHVLNSLFVDRKSFLGFLPILKEKLQQSIQQTEKTQSILNDICSDFTLGFSLEEDQELALGAISVSERQDIIVGLDMLKTVRPEKKAIEQSVACFDFDENYIYLLEKLLTDEEDILFFQKLLDKLISSTQSFMQQDRWALCKKIFLFFAEQLSENSPMKNAGKQLVVESLNVIHPLLLEKAIIAAVSELGHEQNQEYFEGLFLLFKERLLSQLIKVYIQAKVPTQMPLLRKIIVSQQSLNLLPEIELDLRSEVPANVMRAIDIFQEINNETILTPFWDITFHENAILAQRALKLIAETKTTQAMTLLLKTLKRSNIPLRIASIEYLGGFKNKQVITTLVPIARGQEYATTDEQINTDIRLAALKSLLCLDAAYTKVILKEIVSKKRLFLIPLEAKKLRSFAKEQLKLLTS